MASVSAFVIAPPPTTVLVQQISSSGAGLRPMSFSARKSSCTSIRRLEIRASATTKEKVVSVATAAAMAAALAVPQVADAAGPGISPSLRNFLLSIVAGGVVLTVLVGAVIGVANFDPVKRG